ncbi:MAG: sigma-70 family RNA polymerase sigma factor [Ekhidna sp.]|nr:sigma-70 family RNA polymerase sigma factor [Ekhidna sp.]
MLDAIPIEMPTEVYNEVALIEQAKGDPSAFEHIYNRYFDAIFLFVNKRLNDRSSAFDLTQQVFFNALNNLKSYHHRGFPFSSFLYRIAINECNQYFRQSNRVRYTSIDHESIDLLANEVPGVMDKEESLATLQSAIQLLSAKEIMLLELRYFEQRSFRDVAQLLNISESNCKVKMHRVLKKLKKELKG